MIEELQAILELLGDITGIAGWVLGGFVLYKAVIYLSTAGIIYKLVAMFILKTYGAFTDHLANKLEQAKAKETKEYYHKIKDITCGEGVAEGVMDLMKKVRTHANMESNSYGLGVRSWHSEFFSTDLNFMKEAVAERIAKEEAARHERSEELKGKVE